MRNIVAAKILLLHQEDSDEGPENRITQPNFFDFRIDALDRNIYVLECLGGALRVANEIDEPGQQLFAVLRDIVFIAGELSQRDRFDLSSPAGVTDGVFHILRHATVR